MSDTSTIILSILGINIALFAAIATLVIWSFNKMDADVKSLGNRLDGLGNRLDGHASRIDQLYHQFNISLKQSSERTDRLYQMFVDLLKERNDNHKGNL